MLSFLHWDPNRALIDWNLPFLGRPILWYGFLFAVGFFFGYLFFVYLLRRYFSCYPKLISDVKVQSNAVADRLLLYIIIGTLVGARVGDLLFYQDFVEIQRDPLSVFKFWEGGLASHGGTLGVLIAIVFFARRIRVSYPMLTLRRILDLASPPTAFVAVFIRLGNFMNQEILGKPSTLPWAIVFEHPASGESIVPRHPAQLYEALWYFLVGIFLTLLWKRDPLLKKQGKLVGLFLFLFFTFRFFIEFLKVEQSTLLSAQSCFTMGQYLSLPFIGLGAWLVLQPKKLAP